MSGTTGGADKSGGQIESSSDMPAGSVVAPTVFSKNRTGWTLFLLAAIYANNYADRSILGILAQPIKVELNISDTQLGLLTGLAFATFYALFGYPLARASERIGRVNVITACALMWSAMTALCGTAANFTQLMIFRFGVGIGESGLAAPAHSLISDYYPASRRTSAIALFSIGVPIGALIGSVAGGWLAQNYGWRTAFVVASLPGFLLAPLLRFTVKEPPRGNWDASRLAGAAAAPTPPLKEVVKKQFSTKTFRHFCIGTVVATFAGSGGGAFLGAYYVRRFAIDYTTVGLVLGMLSGVAALMGTFLGGFITDFLARWSKRWYAGLPALALACAAPIYLLGYMQTDWRMQVAIMLVSGTLVSLTTVPFYGLTQNLMPARMRASAAAVIFFFINLIGLGFGPLFYGVMIDAVTKHLFAGYGLGEYVALCGNAGVKAAAENIATACHTATAQGTRWTLAAGMIGYVWAAVHFFIASRSITHDLNEAAATN
ncbi:MFS transporter [Phenylobacterium sp.]|uniref:spinster family MFS transporter n=1 Tax=Phenylobacterium sp. TaxID=1871053 RepID=UPI002732A365|nr:MFS transporter [Phenylobacterium sp.]MDP3660990.1 MFS transporter [Phenylobacterium sp.]